MDPSDIRLHLGRPVGDVTQVDLRSLERPVDVLAVGPPCPPWSAQGKHMGKGDMRAQVFHRILDWVFYMVHCCGLLCAIVENVPGIKTVLADGREAPIDQYVRLLEQHVPEFTWRVETLKLVDYLCPQNRAQQRNLKAYENRIRSLVEEGRAPRNSTAVASFDRAEGMGFNTTLSVDVSPTLTCRSFYFAVLSVEDVVSDTPDENRRLFRKLTSPERFALQGFPPSTALQIDSKLAVFSTGNAYPPPLLLAVLAPLLKRM
ncbi:unnamed protein product, partial [Prorocentrum cordatum]